MTEKKHLYVLWTNADPITAENMVFMYTTNALFHGWWEEVTLIIWGAPAQLVAENEHIQTMIKDAQKAGVYISACKACADKLGVRDKLEKLDIEVKHWGDPLTAILKNDEKILTV